MVELKLTYVVRCLVSLLLKKTYQIPIDKHIPSNSPKFIRSYNKDGGQRDNRCVSFWLMLLVMVVEWGRGVYLPYDSAFSIVNFKFLSFYKAKQLWEDYSRSG